GAGRAGKSPVAGFDGLEDVVGGGPEGEFGVDEVAAVIEGAAEAGGELGEDGLDGGGALSGLAGLAGDGDVEAGGDSGGEVGVAGVPGVEQGVEDLIGDPG